MNTLMKVGDPLKLDGEIVCANFDFNRGRRGWGGYEAIAGDLRSFLAFLSTVKCFDSDKTVIEQL